MTKKQRNKVYRDMLDWFLDHNDHYDGLCWTRAMVCGLDHYGVNDLPELLFQSPPNARLKTKVLKVSAYIPWFTFDKSGNEQRIKALLVAIMCTV